MSSLLSRRQLLAACGLLSAAGFSALAAAAEPAAPQVIGIGGTGAALGLMRVIGDEYVRSRPGVQIQIAPSLGSGGGLKALAAGALQIAVTSRPLSDEERARHLQAIEYVRTPFVFVVQRSNPLGNVTLDDVADAYAGRRKSWPDGQPVRPVLRPLTDVDTSIVAGMSPALKLALAAAHQLPGKNVAITDSDIANEMERVPGSIGTSTLVLVRAEQRALKPLAIGGVEPTVENMRRGSYPYQKSIYVIVRPDASPATRAFVEHLQSAALAPLLARLGAVAASGTP